MLLLVKSPEETWEILIQPFQMANMSINEKTLAWIEAKRRKESGVDEGDGESGKTDEVTASEGDLKDQDSANAGDERAEEVDASENGEGIDASKDAKN